jgi:uncharacterized protein YdhG (YjbR/CyaY superfamily)
MSPPAKTVDEYIAAAPREMQKSLRDMRNAIRSAAPKAEETIGWRMPYYKYHGVLVFFAAFKNHMSFFPGSKSTVKEFGTELNGFEISGTTIHFTPDRPLPGALVKQMVRARMRENESRARLKKAKGRA